MGRCVSYASKHINSVKIMMSTLYRLFCLVFIASFFPMLAFAQGEDCANPYVIPSLPFTQNGFSTCGFGNDYDNANNICQSILMNGEDFVFEFTPATSNCFNIALTGTLAAASVMVSDG